MPITADDKRLDEEVTVQLRKRDILLIRSGLEELLQTYTRNEQLYDDIHEAMSRLPEVEEPELAGASA